MTGAITVYSVTPVIEALEGQRLRTSNVIERAFREVRRR